MSGLSFISHNFLPKGISNQDHNPDCEASIDKDISSFHARTSACGEVGSADSPIRY